MGLGDLNPIDNSSTWDFVEIAGVENPGYCVVSGFKRQNEWDVKKGKGTVGATLTYSQKPPAKGKVKFFLWDTKHFYEWDDFLPLLKYDPTRKSVQAVSIWHPALEMIDVNSVVVENVGQLEHEGKSLYSIEVDFIEYFPVPPKSATGTPTGATSSSGANTPGAPPDPIADAQQAEIKALLAKASAP